MGAVPHPVWFHSVDDDIVVTDYRSRIWVIATDKLAMDVVLRWLSWTFRDLLLLRFDCPRRLVGVGCVLFQSPPHLFSDVPLLEVLVIFRGVLLLSVLSSWYFHCLLLVISSKLL